MFRLGGALLAVGATGVALCAAHPAFVLGMVQVAAADAVAIPNIVSQALRAYGDRLGAAGAGLSMIYYSLLGLGLLMAGYHQLLADVLVAGATLAVLMVAAIKTPSRI